MLPTGIWLDPSLKNTKSSSHTLREELFLVWFNVHVSHIVIMFILSFHRRAVSLKH